MDSRHESGSDEQAAFGVEEASATLGAVAVVAVVRHGLPKRIPGGVVGPADAELADRLKYSCRSRAAAGDETRVCGDELGSAMLFITHDLAVAAEIADRVMVLYSGRVAEVGAPDEVFAHPSHPYTAALLRSRLTLSGGARDLDLSTLPGEPPDPRRPPPGCPFAPRCRFAEDVCEAKLPEPKPAARHAGLDACVRSTIIGGELTAAVGPALKSGDEGGVHKSPHKTKCGAEALVMRDIARSFRSRRHTQAAIVGVSLEVPLGGPLAW